MHARVAELARASRRRNSPAAVPPPTNTEIVVAGTADQPSESSGHQSTPIEVAGDGAPSDVRVEPSVILSPGAIVAIEIASSGSKDSSGDVEGAPAAGPSKSKKRKRKSKRPSKGKSSSKSSKRSSKRAERRAAKDAAEEEENTRQFKDQVTWWKQAREDLKTPSSRVAEMEGEKLNPDWAISSRSSVLRTLVGQDSFELYKTCCLDRDQVLLAQTAHTRVEEHLAHVLMQSLESAKASEKKALDAKVAADAQVADALEQGRSDGFSAGRLAGKTEGMIEGREAFLQSDDYKRSISSARLEGARDFLKSSVFKMAVDLQSAQFLNEGFDKCIAQVDHLQGFAEGFDQTRLDASLDSHLQPYPSVAEPESASEDEFATLTSELDLP
ncbi:hypothetical protein Salat_2122100 [Sesamum alatum]|uniref:Uncharacterized protein n=1 Tax=Sesamum alatum TaxID=300844 RepID=A0AAE2CGZ9_9LAMI|nr:hypothetical protein Salat_2122100 [Sesamum alatum]